MREATFLVLGAVLMTANVASAGYVDPFTSDTSANYTEAFNFFGASGGATATTTYGPSTLNVMPNENGGELSMSIALTQGETLDVGEFVETQVTHDITGGRHWRFMGLYVADVDNPASGNGNGFFIVYDPTVANYPTRNDVHVDGFGTHDSGEGIVDVAPQAANVYALAPGLSGNTHTLEILKENSTTLKFLYDSNVLYTATLSTTDINNLTHVGMLFGEWDNKQPGTPDGIGDFEYFNVAVVPEPGAFVLLVMGLAAVLCCRRRSSPHRRP